MNCRNCIHSELIDNEQDMFTCTKYAETVSGNNGCSEWKSRTILTNRFYYSEKQATLWGENDANKVFNGKEWVAYSEWVSKNFPDNVCNWDDAILVFETEKDNPPVEVNLIKLEKYFDE